MPTYNLLGSIPTVQVLSPTQVIDVLQTTMHEPINNVIASLAIPQAAVTSGSGVDILNEFAYVIVHFFERGYIQSASGTQTLDASGLLYDVVTFTVKYTPPGSITGPLTTDVDIPVSWMTSAQVAGPTGTQNEAIALLDAAYASLETLAAG